MEREKVFMNEGNTIPPTWISSEQIPNCFFNPNWENSMDQSDPFESALSSIVSSPGNSNPGIPGNHGENIVLRELIGRLGSICNSGDISPHSYIGGNNSTNTSCYNTPMNSPPKLNLSTMDHQIRENLPFSSDPGLAERAARFSCFGGFNSQTGEKESKFVKRLTPPRMESGKLSRVSSNRSFKVGGSQMRVQENRDVFLQEGIQVSDKKFSRLSRSSTPEKAEFGDSVEESSVSEQFPGGEISRKSQSDANAKKRKSISRGKAKELEVPSSPSAKDSKVAGENEESNSKRRKAGKGKADGKAAENGKQNQTKENSKPPESPKDYIHVRARRGQATDSHSLAERVRREKISERMKFLQDLVPGCDKVTGKAVMLDEIINYVQSLQRQVEFLSMKLANVNPTRMDLNMEALLSKDIFQSRGSLLSNVYQVDTSAQGFPYTYQSQQGSNLHINMPNGTETPFSINSLNAAIPRNAGMQLPSIDGFSEAAASQVSPFWENDLQSVVHMGFDQNLPESFIGSNATTHMKVEQ